MDVYFDKLELHGFKSFPEKTVIKFHRGITAFIGPNGCGKSNIVDAVLWVLGEQRIRNLRGENNVDLIFNGSSSKKPLGMTEVGAFFANQGKPLYIARRYFRTGESKYILNEKFCRNKDIQDVLFDMQMGGRNYFIFEQGSIQKVVSLKPSERRALIEEAAGISQYLERKKETENKLIITEQNLENIDMLIADKKNRLRELKNQINYIQRYRKQKNEKIEFLKALLKKKYDFYKNDFEVDKSKVENFMAQEAYFVKEISSIEKILLNLEEKRWAIDSDLKKVQKDIFIINEEILSLKNEIEKLNQGKGFNTQKLVEIENLVKSNKVEVINLEKEIGIGDEKANKFKSELELENSKYKELKSQLLLLNENLKNFNEHDSEMKSDIFNTQAEISEVKNKIYKIDREMVRIENELQNREKFIEELKTQVSIDDIEKVENNYSELYKRCKEKEIDFKKTEEEYKKNVEKTEELNMKSKKYESEIENLLSQRNKYIEMKKKICEESLEDSSINNYGSLQDIIKADKSNYKLLENFYYDEMGSIITEKNEDVLRIGFNKCLLKRDKNDNFPTEVEKEKGFVSFVKDLFVLKDENLKSYFKNGALVDDLNNGIKIFVKYGINIVTKNSEVITSEGILVKNRGKGILDVITEIREIDESILRLEKELEVLRANLGKEKLKKRELMEKIEEETLVLNKLKEESIFLKTQAESMKKNREHNLKRVEINKSEIDLILLEKRKNEDELKIAKKKQDELDKKYQILVGKRTRFLENEKNTKDEINRVEKNFLKRESSISLLNEKSNSISSNNKRLKENKSRLLSNIKFKEKEVLKLNIDLGEIDIKKKRITETAKDLEIKKEDLENLIKKHEEEFKNINLKIKNNSEDLNNKRKSLEQIKEDRNRIEIRLSSIKKDLFQLEDISFRELNTELRNIEASVEMMGFEISELEQKTELYNERLVKMRDSNKLNFSAESEHEILSKDCEFLLAQKEDIVKSICDMNNAIERIDSESRESFFKAFDEVNRNFKKNFQILFEGGESEISLMDKDNILETGLEIKAQPPGKKLQNLRLLSGGEKALTSLAFLFALFEYRPSPFCIFDEVDASLDEANVQRFLKFLHKLKEKTQFLIITHNFKTMEEADYIYGVTMSENGISNIYSTKMNGSIKGLLQKPNN